MDDKTRQEFILIFNQGFEEVVIPAIEDLRREMNLGFKKVNQRFEDMDKRFESIDRRFEDMDARFDRLERKVDTISEKQLETDNTLVTHGKRISKLESTQPAS